MTSKLNLLLTVPQGSVTATSLGIDGYAWHRSPGSGRLPRAGGRPGASAI